jgi:hypothetical protein
MSAEAIAFVLIAGSVLTALGIVRVSLNKRLTLTVWLVSLALTTAMTIPIIIKLLCVERA